MYHLIDVTFRSAGIFAPHLQIMAMNYAACIWTTQLVLKHLVARLEFINLLHDLIA